MKKTSTTIFLMFFFAEVGFSQDGLHDFIPNGGFEEYKNLPSTDGQLCRAKNWGNVYGTPDFYFNNPKNKTASGIGCAGIDVVSVGEIGEMIQSTMVWPKVKNISEIGVGSSFEISLDVKFIPSKSNCSVDAICGFLNESQYAFTSFNSDGDSSTITPLDKKKFIKKHMFVLTKKDKSPINDTVWTTLSVKFEARDRSISETYVCIGNYFKDVFKTAKAGILSSGNESHSYYLLDNFSVKAYILTAGNTPIQTNANQVKFDLNKLEINKPIVLKNIFFETNKFKLLSTSFSELDKLVKLMTDNPTMEIEVDGHTDNHGSLNDNQKLSEQRALSVKNYLVSKNILINRISDKGDGSTKPIASNDTEDGRQQNRRVEFIIKKK